MDTLLTEAPAATAAATSAATAAAATTNQGSTDGTANGATNTTPPARWTVPEDYRGQDAVRKFIDDKHTLDPAVLLKSHVELEKKFGRDKIVLPTTPEEKREVWSKLGCPAQPEMYSYKPPAELPAGVQHNAETEKYWRNAAYQNGLSDEQFNGLAKLFLDGQANSVAGWQQAATEAKGKITGDLKREWGAAYDQNVAAAKITMKEYADPDLNAYLEESGLGNDPRLIKVFAKIGAELLGEAKLKGASNGDGGAMTPEQVETKIKEFREANHKALFDSEHIDHKRLVAQLDGLYKMKHTRAA